MELEGLGRLLLATGLGLVVGVDRELRGHDAGLRTHIGVSLGAALFGVVVTLGFRDVSPDPGTRAEAARAAGQVVVGIGFLGAGAIVKLGPRVRGLTTAASLWVTAAIGLACGVGSEGPAIATTVLLVLLLLLRYPEGWLRRWRDAHPAPGDEDARTGAHRGDRADDGS